MRLANTRSLSAGDILARSIFNEKGVALLQHGMVLTEAMIIRLINLGITYVYIADEVTAEIEVDSIISDQLRVEATRFIKNTFSNLTEDGFYEDSYISNTSNEQLGSVVDKIMGEISHQNESISLIADILISDDYTFQHSLNVAVYSLTIGNQLNYSSKQLSELGKGAILHDIGKVFIDKEVLQKPDQLTDTEYGIVKTHAELGFEYLRKQNDLSTVIAHCAYQHHERLDGSGYPRGIKGSEIHPYAKIIAIADVFDAMTSNRVYRKALLPHDALEVLYAGADQKFDIKMVEAFRNSITIYPNGLSVELNDGRIGVVVRQNKHLNDRPVVRVLKTKNEQKISPYDVNLATEMNVMIIACLD